MRDAAGRIVDLGCGSGANMRYMAGVLAGPHEWVLVDHDPALLEAARRQAAGRAIPGTVSLREADLTTLHPDLFGGAALVTASALLDLVSPSWIERLGRWCRLAGAVGLYALSYDGRWTCRPEDPLDEGVRALVNRHQRTDKGFGPAAGPQAVEVAVSALTDLGYRVERERSDWQLGSGDVELQRELIAGWAAAAIEMDPEQSGSIRAWHGRRLEHAAAGRSRIVVGHEDLACWIAADDR